MPVHFCKEALGRHDIEQPTIKGNKTWFKSNEKKRPWSMHEYRMYTVELKTSMQVHRIYSGMLEQPCTVLLIYSRIVLHKAALGTCTPSCTPWTVCANFAEYSDINYLQRTCVALYSDLNYLQRTCVALTCTSAALCCTILE
jgi:hypothetical protein